MSTTKTKRIRNLEEAIENLKGARLALMKFMYHMNFNNQGKEHSETMGRDFDVAIDSMKRELASLQSENLTSSGWVSVKDALPEKETEVLVSFDDGFMHTTGLYKDEEDPDSDYDWELWADAGEVVAWMPLPEPYPV